MQLLGHRPGRLLAAWTALGALAAAVPALWMWGFTVDDALIAVRYGRHLAEGLGWRFNAHGPSTDGVTPLPWPLLLAPFAGADALAVLDRAKALGLVAWSVAGAGLGRALGRELAAPAWARGGALLTLALSVPVAAHAVSGMETALATALATGAALLGTRPRAAALVAGLAASLRPEMAPWAVVLAVGFAIAGADAGADADADADAGGGVVAVGDAGRAARGLRAGALALAPFAVCALARALAWGRPAPLAVLAKPSDLAHGLAYAGAACVVTLAPILVVAPLALAGHARGRALALAGLAHVGSIVAVGGDWMPYARLMVPVVPSLVYAAVLASTRARPAWTALRSCAAIVVGGDWMPYARLMVPVAPSLVYAAVLASTRAGPAWTALRSCAAIAVGVTLVARGGTAGRTVGVDRAALVVTARPWLEGAARVAALDIGWVSAATEADIVDLAGLTDLEIASLPGGHTSKRVDARFFLDRAPDTLLLYAPLGLPVGGLAASRDLVTPRAVEARLVDDDVIARHFAPAAWLPLGSSGAGYVLLRSR